MLIFIKFIIKSFPFNIFTFIKFITLQLFIRPTLLKHL